jgi:hypothetical protein
MGLTRMAAQTILPSAFGMTPHAVLWVATSLSPRPCRPLRRRLERVLHRTEQEDPTEDAGGYQRAAMWVTADDKHRGAATGKAAGAAGPQWMEPGLYFWRPSTASCFTVSTASTAVAFTDSTAWAAGSRRCSPISRALSPNASVTGPAC